MERTRKEYFAFRLQNWKTDQRIEEADHFYNQIKYGVGSLSHELKVCIPIIAHKTDSSSLKATLESVSRQKYRNYQIVIYSQDGVDVEVKNAEKVEVVRGRMGELKECAGSEVVLMMGEG